MINIQNLSASVYGAQFLPPAFKTNGKTDQTPLPLIGSNSEKVDLSETSVTISRLREKIDALPEVRIKLVEEIKQKIQQNDYPYTTNLYNAVDKMMDNNIISTN